MTTGKPKPCTHHQDRSTVRAAPGKATSDGNGCANFAMRHRVRIDLQRTST